MIKVFDNALLRQYVVVILVNLSVLSSGLGLVWVSPVLVKLSNSTQTVLPTPITEAEGSWIVSITGLTGFLATFFVAILVDHLGRKAGLIMSAVPKIIAAFLFIFSREVWLIYLGRGLVGVSDTGTFTILPIYASEVASKEIRGSLGTLLQIMCSVGIVIMLSMGPFVEYLTLNIVFAVIVVISSVPLAFLPESPYFLCSKGRTEQSLKVLTFLRGSATLASEELKEYETAAAQNSNNMSKAAIFKNKLFLKSLVLVLVMGMGTQLVGYNTITFYLQTILESTQTSVSSQSASVIIGLIQLFASFCTSLVTNRFGRKSILNTTCVGMAIGMFGLGLFFKLKQMQIVGGFLNFLPLISLVLFVFCYSAGLGSLFWVVSAELFDDRSRGIGMSFALIDSCLFIFLLSKFFASTTAAIGPAATYWIFCANCLLMLMFVTFFLPETKGKSFGEIQEMLGRKRKEKKSDGC